jgi:hypothetical protein
VDEPDRKGQRWLRIRPHHGSGGVMVEAAEEWPALGPFLDRVGTAIAARQAG